MESVRKPHLFNVRDYYRMAEAGILRPEDRVELLEGEIVEMSPIGSPHGGTVNELSRLLVVLAGEDAVVAIQNPLRISELSEPQPDVAILKPRSDRYRDAHPGPKDVLLLIEVADTSLDKDRGKAALYASARIPEYWIVNLAGDCIEVHRQPITGGYRQVTAFARGQTIPIKAFRGKKLAVNAILGKKSKR